VFGLLEIKNVTPLGFSQQSEALRILPDKIFYMEGSFYILVEVTARDPQEEWLSVELRIRPIYFLSRLRQSLTIFSLPDCSLVKARFIHLHAIMEDPAEGFLGLLLGHYSSAQIDRTEDPFQIAGESVPWNLIINPL